MLRAQAKFAELGFDIRPSKQAAADRATLAHLNLELKKSTSLADEAAATLHVRQMEHAAEVARLHQVLTVHNRVLTAHRGHQRLLCVVKFC